MHPISQMLNVAAVVITLLGTLGCADSGNQL